MELRDSESRKPESPKVACFRRATRMREKKEKGKGGCRKVSEFRIEISDGRYFFGHHHPFYFYMYAHMPVCCIACVLV